MAAKFDIKETHNWFIGARKQLVFPVKDANGVPVAVDGWDLEWALMTRPSATTYLLHKTSADITEITVIAGPEGEMNTVIVEIEEGDALAAGVRAGKEYYHELKRTDTDDKDVLTFGSAVLRLSGIS